jgi:hypothetical protein
MSSNSVLKIRKQITKCVVDLMVRSALSTFHFKLFCHFAWLLKLLFSPNFWAPGEWPRTTCHNKLPLYISKRSDLFEFGWGHLGKWSTVITFSPRRSDEPYKIWVPCAMGYHLGCRALPCWRRLTSSSGGCFLTGALTPAPLSGSAASRGLLGSRALQAQEQT